MEPNKDHIRLWVEALRSGKYQQGREWLHNSSRYCCLGVACDISDQGVWNDGAYVTLKEYEEQLLPLDVQEWLGIEGAEPKVELPDGLLRTVTWMNDTATYNFNEIADAIECTFLKGDDHAPSGD